MRYGEELSAAWADHLAPRKPDAYTVASLFAGCGGSSPGFSMAGYRELFAVEWDDNAAEVFRTNFPEVRLHHGGIADVAPGALGIAPGELDMLDGSPPCQGFSTSGRRRFDDPRNELFLEYARLLGAWAPRAFVMENVPGMARGKMRLIFAEVMRMLKAAGPGYRVRTAIMDASAFGVPQSRRRLVFIGLRADLGAEPAHPLPTTRPRTVRAAWADLGDPGAWLPVDGKVGQLVPLLAPGENGTKVLARFDRKPAFWDMWRLRWDRPSNTLVRQYAQGLSGIIHPAENRRLGTREASRLQSFPDEFDWASANCQQIHNRIGNSVPPLLMRAVAHSLRDQLDAIDKGARHGTSGTGAEADAASPVAR